MEFKERLDLTKLQFFLWLSPFLWKAFHKSGQTRSGKTIKKNAQIHLVLWIPPKTEEMMRFSIIYEFNDSEAITIYERYLTDIVIPKIPPGAQLIIHGHTDIIGDEPYNLALSLARANDARDIIKKGLLMSDRSDVKISIFAFGEDQEVCPFENKFPEERFYNRTVIIDIIPNE
jgi:hypothetical protein